MSSINATYDTEGFKPEQLRFELPAEATHEDLAAVRDLLRSTRARLEQEFREEFWEVRQWEAKVARVHARIAAEAAEDAAASNPE